MQQIIFSLISEALFNKECDLQSDIDLDAVRKEADIQEVSPLIYSVLKKKNMLSEEFDASWRKFLTLRLAKGHGVFLTHVKVSSIFEKAGIIHTTIKGVASASYYEEPFLRVMGDTDVIVKEEDFEKASETLKSNGYIWKKTTDYHTVFCKNFQEIELHHALAKVGEDKKQEVNQLLSDMYINSKKYSTVFGEVTVPSDFHHGFIMLIHMYNHINSSGMGLRHLCDWAVFIEKFSEDEFVEIFKEKLKNIGLWQFAVKISQACLSLGVSQKNWMGTIDDEFCQFFFNDVMAGGNFGRKDDDRRAILGFTPKAKEKRTSPVIRYFQYGIGSMKRIWPFFDKYKILMPIGFIGYCFRVLFRLVWGKSKIYDLTAGYKRRDFYERLKWFEKEK